MDTAISRLTNSTTVRTEFGYPSSAEDPQRNRLSDGSGGTRVLLVDDDAASLRLLGLFFSGPNFYAKAVTNCEKALATLQDEPFDAVISDLRMPGMGGMELLARVREKYRHTAFLITTGVDEVEIGVRAIKSGADDYLVKPLVEAAVLTSVERSLHNRRLEQQLETYREHLECLVESRTRELQAALRHIKSNYEETLQALGAAIDLRDNETAGHSRRVCRYAQEIAGAMGLSDSQVSSIARGAYLHDIGKLGIPDGILFKPGPLSSEERKVMQQHVRLGFELVKGIPFLADAAEVVLTHHERFNGTGYPNGLKEREIPIGGRIFAVADTLDAITSDRPYQRASSFDSARNTIASLSGAHFDPQIATAFLGVPSETWSDHCRASTGPPERRALGSLQAQT